jgi:hypothetical protein
VAGIGVPKAVWEGRGWGFVTPIEACHPRSLLSKHVCYILYVGNPDWATYRVSAQLNVAAETQACLSSHGAPLVRSSIDGFGAERDSVLPRVSSSRIPVAFQGYTSAAGGRRRVTSLNSSNIGSSLSGAASSFATAARGQLLSVKEILSSNNLVPGPYSKLTTPQVSVCGWGEGVS